MPIFPRTVTVSANNSRWRSGLVKLLVNVKSCRLMVAWNKKTSAACELLSCRSVETKCSRCCTTSTSLMIHRCRFMRTVHPAGLTHWTTRSSTIAWFLLAQPRATPVFGKCRWLCGKIWTEAVAPWVTLVQTQPSLKTSIRWFWRTSNVITQQAAHLSDYITTLLGSRNLITKKASCNSLTPSTQWTTSILSPIGRHFNGSVIQHRCHEWIHSSHSSAIIR